MRQGRHPVGLPQGDLVRLDPLVELANWVVGVEHRGRDGKVTGTVLGADPPPWRLPLAGWGATPSRNNGCR